MRTAQLSALNLLDASAPLLTLTSHLSLSSPVRSDRLHRRQVRRAIAAGECSGRNQADLLEVLIVTPHRPETPWTPHTLRIIYPALRLVSPLWTFVFIGSFSVLLFRPQISSPSLAFVSPPRPCLTCVRSHASSRILRLSDALSIVLTVYDIHLDWELDFFHCRRLSCVLFFF